MSYYALVREEVEKPVAGSHETSKELSYENLAKLERLFNHCHRRWV